MSTDRETLFDATDQHAEALWSATAALHATLTAASQVEAPALPAWSSLSERQRRRFVRDTAEARVDALHSATVVATETDR